MATKGSAKEGSVSLDPGRCGCEDPAPTGAPSVYPDVFELSYPGTMAHANANAKVDPTTYMSGPGPSPTMSNVRLETGCA